MAFLTSRLQGKSCDAHSEEKLGIGLNCCTGLLSDGLTTGNEASYSEVGVLGTAAVEDDGGRIRVESTVGALVRSTSISLLPMV